MTNFKAFEYKIINVKLNEIIEMDIANFKAFE